MSLTDKQETDEWQKWNGEAMALGNSGNSTKGRSSRSGVNKKHRGPAFSKIIKEASDHVDVFGKELVQSLYDSAIDGNASSARLLLDLAEYQDNEVDEGMPLNSESVAKRLAAEKQWTDDQEDSIEKPGLVDHNADEMSKAQRVC